MNSDLLNKLKEVPISVVEDLIRCKESKSEFVKKQEYELAAKMRDMERVICDNYPQLYDIIFEPNIKIILRDLKIESIVE